MQYVPSRGPRSWKDVGGAIFAVVAAIVISLVWVRLRKRPR